MKIYVAHNFKARSWLPAVIDRIKSTGHEVTSTWVYDDSHEKGGTQLDSAKVDIADIDRSACVVLFVDQFGDRPGKGKYFELGYAYAQGKRIILVGADNSCVFFALPGMIRISCKEELIDFLKREGR